MKEKIDYIDILEDFIDYNSFIKYFTGSDDLRQHETYVSKNEIKAVETLISEYKELKENSIPKSKVEEKIEEINKEMLNEENSLELFNRKRYCREVLKSLLGKE